MTESFAEKLRKLEIIVERAPWIDRRRGISREEFAGRRRRVWAAVQRCAAVDVAFAFSDEHYSGDVPYLGGNTNYSIEQVAFGLGPDPIRSGIIAGFEGVYVAGQLAPRAGAAVYPTESLQLADEKYPVEGFSLKDILEKIAGKKLQQIGLLTPRQVIPESVAAHLESLVGPGNVVDVQRPFQEIKNLKSDAEMKLLEDAAHVCSLALRAMLAVMEPGMDETQVAAFGDMLAKWMGCERKGFETIVGSDSACVTMIGPALNRPIQPGAPVHLGASYKRDGLTACVRRSVFSSADIPAYLAYFRDLVEGGFRAGFDAYVSVVRNRQPARLQEQALIDFFNERTAEALEVVRREFGEKAAKQAQARLHEPLPGIGAGLARLKPYTGTHNAGYTECQEFYGAITLESDSPLDDQVVTMLDVALRGRGSRWTGSEFEPILPGFDYWVVEDTLGKYGAAVRNLTGAYGGQARELESEGKPTRVSVRLPVNVQHLVGNVAEFA
jgi:Xaa-Pro aminopeptidase